MTTKPVEVTETEIERVERWRMTELLRVGFSADSAIKLAARTDVDLHKAIDLVTAKGCTPELAAKILL